MVPWLPPLGRQDSIISIEWCAKLRHAPPPFVTWAESLSAQTVGEDLCFWPSPNFGPKTGLNLCEDLFFEGGLHLILGTKNGLEKFSFPSSSFSKFLNFLPPPFENPAYATGRKTKPTLNCFSPDWI